VTVSSGDQAVIDSTDSLDGHGYASVAVTVDLVVLTIRQGRLEVLLIERGSDPFKGQSALPGGFVQSDEDLDDAAAHVLARECGSTLAHQAHFEQLRTYGRPDRDPRLRVVSVAYVAFVPDAPEPRAGSDAASAHFRLVADLLAPQATLAFDHARILGDAVERARAKLEYTSLATSFVTSPFTVADLRRVYETVWGATLEPNNFRRKVQATDGFVIETAAARTGPGRPARLYRPGHAATLHPPLLRPRAGDEMVTDGRALA
jgi:8-oxo-dGTP diphosphatase